MQDGQEKNMISTSKVYGTKDMKAIKYESFLPTPGHLRSEEWIVVEIEGREYHAFQLDDDFHVELFDLYRDEDERFEHSRVKIRISKEMSEIISQLFSHGDLYRDAVNKDHRPFVHRDS